MNKAYLRVSWGLVLVLIDFRIQYFDIFPDILGYLFINIGLAGIRVPLRHFTIARVAAGILMLGALTQFFGVSESIMLMNSNFETPGIPLLLQSSIFILVELVMLYGICQGIRACARAQRNWKLAKSSDNCWRMNFVTGLMMLLLLPYQLNTQTNEYTLWIIALGFGFFIANLFVIVIARRAGRELHIQDDNSNGHIGKNIDVLR